MKGHIAWMLMGVLPLAQAAALDWHGYRNFFAHENTHLKSEDERPEMFLKSGNGRPEPLHKTVVVTHTVIPEENVIPNLHPIISGASSHQGIVIVSLTDAKLPTTTLQVSTTATNFLNQTSLEVPTSADTATLVEPIETTEAIETSEVIETTEAVETTEAIDTTEVVETTATETTEAVETTAAETTSTEVATSEAVETTTVAEIDATGTAVETALQSSFTLGLGGDGPPSGPPPGAPEQTGVPVVVLNPAVGEEAALTLDADVVLASTLQLGNLMGAPPGPPPSEEDEEDEGMDLVIERRSGN